MNEDPDLVYKLALGKIQGIGAVSVRNLVSYLGGVKQVFKATRKDLSRVPGIGEFRIRDLLKSDALKEAESEAALLTKLGIRVYFYLDAEYPQRLKQYATSPLILYVRGDCSLESKHMVAIVGTRSPSDYGTHVCEKIVRDLAKWDVTVISGLAYGIDAVAHRSALDCCLSTIGVLGSGLDKIYPSLHTGMAEKIIEKGALISEFPPGTKPDRENFPRRNRIIASLCDVLIVVESGIKGGSIISAEYANEYSKDVFAVPGSINAKMSEGCNHLIKTHKAHLYTGVNDISYIARWLEKPVQRLFSFKEDLNEDERKVVDLLDHDKLIRLDTLHYRSGLQLSLLSSILLNLEIRGLVKSMPGKSFILAP